MWSGKQGAIILHGAATAMCRVWVQSGMHWLWVALVGLAGKHLAWSRQGQVAASLRSGKGAVHSAAEHARAVWWCVAVRLAALNVHGARCGLCTPCDTEPYVTVFVTPSVFSTLAIAARRSRGGQEQGRMPSLLTILCMSYAQVLLHVSGRFTTREGLHVHVVTYTQRTDPRPL